MSNEGYGVEYLGQVAFEAYAEDRKNVAFNGSQIPQWDKVGFEVQHAWITGVVAVLNLIIPPEECDFDCDCAYATVECEYVDGITTEEYLEEVAKISEATKTYYPERFNFILDGWLRLQGV